jgi:hypothetical protein
LQILKVGNTEQYKSKVSHIFFLQIITLYH